jgi:hypothetical protein
MGGYILAILSRIISRQGNIWDTQKIKQKCYLNKNLKQKENEMDKDSNVCKHNNTITNECSDCNEQELFDVFLKHTLEGIREILWAYNNNNVSDAIDDMFGGDVDYSEELAKKLENEILRRLTYEEK